MAGVRSPSRARPARAPVPALGLVLTAGGARGAYQAGVLQRIGEIPAFVEAPLPFPIVTGASAGAINGAAIASHAERFGDGTGLIARLWSALRMRDVVRIDTPALARNAARIAADLALGGLIGAGRAQALLDAAPLADFLQRALRPGAVARGIDAGHLRALAITATGYHSGRAFTFVQGREGLPLWQKARRLALAAEIGVDHIRASAAIPLVFPPVPLSIHGGTAYFGDGAMRLTAPLSPAIRLGAQRVLAIGIRSQGAASDLMRAELAPPKPEKGRKGGLQRPPLSQICGVFLNAIFLDHLDADLEHLRRMNELIGAYTSTAHQPAAVARVREPMRVVRALSVSPSQDLAVIARRLAHRLPRSLRYLLDGLGEPDEHSADLLSYLLFDASFTRELVDIGWHDADARIDEIEDFLRKP